MPLSAAVPEPLASARLIPVAGPWQASGSVPFSPLRKGCVCGRSQMRAVCTAPQDTFRPDWGQAEPPGARALSPDPARPAGTLAGERRAVQDRVRAARSGGAEEGHGPADGHGAGGAGEGQGESSHTTVSSVPATAPRDAHPVPSRPRPRVPCWRSRSPSCTSVGRSGGAWRPSGPSSLHSRS